MTKEKGKLGAVLAVAGGELRYQSRNPVLIPFVIILLLYYTTMNSIFKIVSSVTGYGIHPWIFSVFAASPPYSQYNAMMLAFVISEAPFIRKNTLFLIKRCGYTVWAIGKMVYISAAAAAYLVIHFFVGMLSLMPYLTFGTGWGTVLYTASNTDILSQYGLVSISPSPNLILEMGALEAEGKTMLLVFLFIVACGMIVFFVNARTGTYAGTVAILALVFMEGIYIILEQIFSFGWRKLWPFFWMNPGNLVDYDIPFWEVYLVLLVVIIIFSGLTVWAAKKRKLKIL